jgi:hypothetical protein
MVTLNLYCKILNSFYTHPCMADLYHRYIRYSNAAVGCHFLTQFKYTYEEELHKPTGGVKSNGFILEWQAVSLGR